MSPDPVIRESLRNLPRSPGVYLFKDGSGSVIYIGKAINLKNRVRSYFNPRAVAADNRLKVKAMIRHIRRIDTIVVKTEAEALILEGRLLKEYKPKYNTDFVDDKRFLLIRVDSSVLPRFTLCRNRVDSVSAYYGPFVHGAAVKKLYYELRRNYGVLLSDGVPAPYYPLKGGEKLNWGADPAKDFPSNEGNPEGKGNNVLYRLYNDARAEIFEFSNIVTRGEYLERVAKACAFLDGQTRLWRREVFDKMTAAAEARKFEEAAKWRDLLQALAQTRNPERKFLRDPMLKLLDPARAMDALRGSLQMETLPISIECFDISHISGSFVVASLVHFDNGKPNKRLYRCFKIKGGGTVRNDDYAAMQEVVARHYFRLEREGRAMPSLIVVDGGAGQLKAALAAFLKNELAPPMMIGLAKKEETFVFSDGRPPLTLPRNHEGLRLLQRVRDEAHRVANSFNADWRSRALKTSVLDEIPGVGPVKRKKLLEKFLTIEGLKKAGFEKLAAVVGPKLAAVISEFLKSV